MSKGRPPITSREILEEQYWAEKGGRQYEVRSSPGIGGFLGLFVIRLVFGIIYSFMNLLSILGSGSMHFVSRAGFIPEVINAFAILPLLLSCIVLLSKRKKAFVAVYGFASFFIVLTALSSYTIASNSSSLSTFLGVLLAEVFWVVYLVKSKKVKQMLAEGSAKTTTVSSLVDRYLQTPAIGFDPTDPTSHEAFIAQVTSIENAIFTLSVYMAQLIVNNSPEKNSLEKRCSIFLEIYMWLYYTCSKHNEHIPYMSDDLYKQVRDTKLDRFEAYDAIYASQYNPTGLWSPTPLNIPDQIIASLVLLGDILFWILVSKKTPNSYKDIPKQVPNAMNHIMKLFPLVSQVTIKLADCYDLILFHVVPRFIDEKGGDSSNSAKKPPQANTNEKNAVASAVTSNLSSTAPPSDTISESEGATPQSAHHDLITAPEKRGEFIFNLALAFFKDAKEQELVQIDDTHLAHLIIETYAYLCAYMLHEYDLSFPTHYISDRLSKSPDTRDQMNDLVDNRMMAYADVYDRTFVPIGLYLSVCDDLDSKQTNELALIMLGDCLYYVMAYTDVFFYGDDLPPRKSTFESLFSAKLYVTFILDFIHGVLDKIEPYQLFGYDEPQAAQEDINPAETNIHASTGQRSTYSSPPPEDGIFCKHCGKPIDSDSLFCRHCGGSQHTEESSDQPTPRRRRADRHKEINDTQ